MLARAVMASSLPLAITVEVVVVDEGPTIDVVGVEMCYFGSRSPLLSFVEALAADDVENSKLIKTLLYPSL